jgi:hypothetical protein
VTSTQWDGNTLTILTNTPTTEQQLVDQAWVKYRKRTAPYLHIRYITVFGKHYTQDGLVGCTFTASITQT